MKSKTKEEYYLANPLVRARRNYDMTGQRIFRLAIANLNPKLKNSEYYDEEFPTFHLSTADVIAKFQGEDGNDHRIYEKLSLAAQNMVESSVRIGNIDSFIAFPVFDMIKFNSKDGLTVVFNRHMKPLLLNLEKGNYSRFYLQLAFELSSKYSLILLELILQYRGVKKYNKEMKCDVIERTLTPEELRFSLDVDDKKYKLTHDFIKYVIDPAIKEINEKTNYYIEPKYKIERGRYRKIKAFVFTMTLPDADAESQPKRKQKKENLHLLDTSANLSEDIPLSESVQAELPTMEKNESQEELQEPKKTRKKLEDYTKEEAYALAKLLKFKITEKVAFTTLEKYGVKAINWAVQDFQSAKNRGVVINNPAGFILDKIAEYDESEVTAEDIFKLVEKFEAEAEEERIKAQQEADKKKAEEEAKQAEEEKARLATRSQFSEEELLSVKEKISQEYIDNNKTFTENMEAEIKKYGLRNVEIISFAFKKSQANVKLRKKEKIRKVEENLEVIKPLEPLDKNFIEKIKANYYQNGNFFSPDVVNQLQKRGWNVTKFMTKFMLNS